MNSVMFNEEWELIEIALDSGAVDSVADATNGEGIEVKETAAAAPKAVEVGWWPFIRSWICPSSLSALANKLMICNPSILYSLQKRCLRSKLLECKILMKFTCAKPSRWRARVTAAPRPIQWWARCSSRARSRTKIPVPRGWGRALLLLSLLLTPYCFICAIKAVPRGVKN